MDRSSADRWIALGLAALALTAVLWAVGHQLRTEVDDAFYYLQIARHLAAGHGATFDGLHPTTGYHLLWLLCLVPVFWLVDQPGSALVVAGALQGGLFAAAVAVLYRGARVGLRRPAAIFATVLWAGVTLHVALLGLEFSLHALCLFAVVWVWLESERDRGRRWDATTAWLLGVLLALAALARLEAGLLAGLVLAWRLRAEIDPAAPPGSLARTLAVAVPVGVAGLIWAGWNLAVDGHLLPVSGAVKRAWSEAWVMHEPLYAERGWWAVKLQQMTWPLRYLTSRWNQLLAIGSLGVVAVVLLGWLPGVAAFRRRTVDRWGPLAAYGVIVGFASLALLRPPLNMLRWYYPLQIWLGAMLLAHAVESLGDRLGDFWPPVRTAATIVLVVASVWFARGAVGWLRSTHDYHVTDRNHLVFLHGADWIRANVAENEVVAAWNSGTLGYFSGRTVINLDGLVNSWRYHLEDSRSPCAYLEREGVDWVVDIFRDRRPLTDESVADRIAPCADRLEPVWVDDGYGALWELTALRVVAEGEAVHRPPGGP